MKSEDDKHGKIRADFVVRSSMLESEPSLPSGLFVKSERMFPLNSLIRLMVELGNGETVPATCRVVYVRDRGAARTTKKPAGMGLELVEVSDPHRKRLDEVLSGAASAERLAASKPLPPAPIPPKVPSSASRLAASPVIPVSSSSGTMPRPAMGSRPGVPTAPADGTPLPVRRTDALSIIVVDDDDAYRELAAEPFRKRGDVVRTTSDGLEALAMCLKEPPDIMLTDVQMPRMDGWQLLRLIRARPALASLPVVFLTTLNGDNDRLLGYQLGVDGYIAKPYKPEELLIRVTQILRRAKSMQSAPMTKITLRGELAHVAPSSLLSFLEMEKKTGTLLLIGNEVSRLFLRDGRVMRAEIEGEAEPRTSRDVFMAVLDWNNGQFEFTPEGVTAADEIKTATTALLLEHARIADERKR
jgi:DNA-binding response OmpR family regulator/Tfp pilus assembly protein PilZ